MNKILLLPLLCLALHAQAQFRLIIDQPASIAREIRDIYPLISDDGSWGINMDTVQRFSAPFFCSPDTLACNAQPAGSMTGKIAIISRGGCPPEVKVYNCQQAGAVGVLFSWYFTSIVLPVGPDPIALQVHIPVILVPRDTVNALRPDICGGSGTIGNAPMAVHQHKGSYITIAPQPARDAFRITGFDGDANITLTDGIGRTVRAWQRAAAGQSLSVSDLAPGLYTIRLEVDGRLAMKKLVVD